MKQLVLFFLLAIQYSYCQKKPNITNYKIGYNGIEFIVKEGNQTIVVSTFNAKKEIKSEIAKKVFQHYVDKTINKDGSVKVKGSSALVTGKCVVTTKGTLTTLNFYYEKVEWNSGLTEVFKKA